MGARGRHTPVLAARHCVALPGHPLPSASVSSSVTWGPQQACVRVRVTEAKCSRRAPSTRSRHLSLSPRFEFLVCGGESGEASLLGRGAAWEQPLRSCTGVPPPCLRLGPEVGGARVFNIQSRGSTAAPQKGVGKPFARVHVSWLFMPETAPRACLGEPSVPRKTEHGWPFCPGCESCIRDKGRGAILPRGKGAEHQGGPPGSLDQ